jgi:8-oxo-dGTP pyrophosphatase MutT (NUDIX family)
MSRKHGTKKAVAILAWFTQGPESTNRVMLTKRLKVKHFSGWYAAVGGSVEKGECAISAATREFFEETGVYVHRDSLRLVDCYQEDDFKCFLFETVISEHRFKEIKNTEPKKHSAWTLYTPKEALKLPNLMPALKEILLTKGQA